jgi:hypothetical protein
MINKEFIFSKIKELEDAPKGVIHFKNNNIYLDLLNLTWQCKETLRGYGVSDSLANKFVNCFGKEAFKELPDPVQAVLVSLWRQFGRQGKFDLPALAMTAKMLIRGHIQAAARYLRNEQGWGLENFMPRRLKEAAILGTFTGEGK